MWLLLIAAAVAVATAVRLLASIWHVHRFVSQYHARCRALAHSGGKCNAAAIHAAYFDPVHRTNAVVTDTQFREIIGKTEKALSARDDAAGIGDGPETVTFRVNSESVAFLAGGRAALLQLAHPFVAAALLAHSSIKRDALTRFLRTFELLFKIMFGTRSEAFAAARLVRRLHNAAHGRVGEVVGGFTPESPFAANHSDALLWVFTTLMDSTVMMYELTFGELSIAEKNMLITSSRRGLTLFGLKEESVPGAWPDFMAYCVHMWDNTDVLAVSESARTVEGLLFKPATRAAAPAMALARTTAAVLLPPRLRKAFGYHVSTPAYVTFCVLAGASRVIYRAIPKSSRLLTHSLRAASRVGRSHCRPLARLSAAVARAFLHCTIPRRPQKHFGSTPHLQPAQPAAPQPPTMTLG